MDAVDIQGRRLRNQQPAHGRVAGQNASPPSDELLLTGSVVDEFGKTVPAAHVRCYDMSPAARPWDWSTPLAAVESDERGRWKLVLSKGDLKELSLVATKVGMAGQHTWLRLSDSHALHDLELCLFESGTLRVRALAGGRVNTGVRIGCVCAQLLGVPHDRFGVTNGNGEFVFDDVVGQVRVSVQGKDGVQAGVLAHVKPGEETAVELSLPSYDLLPVSLAFLDSSPDAPATVRAYIIAGRAASSFELRTDGTEVVRAIDPGRPVSLGIRTPDSTRWNFKWAEARSLVRGGALRVRVRAPAKSRLTIKSESAAVELAHLQCELRSDDGGLRIPLRTDGLGRVNCTLPRQRYGIYVDGNLVGRLDFSATGPEVVVGLSDHGVIGGHYDGPIPTEGAALELRIEGMTSVEGLRGEGEFISRSVTEADWSFAVPWPDGTRLAVRLWRARRPLGPSLNVTVGDRAVELPWTDKNAGVTLRLAPRIGKRVRVLGVLSLSSVAPPSEDDYVLTPVTFSAHVDGTTGRATFHGVPPGSYAVSLTRYAGDRQPLHGLAHIRVSDRDIADDIELGKSGE